MPKKHAPNTTPELLTIREFSEVSRLSVTQIRRLVKAKRVHCLQPGGRGGKLLFPLDALDALGERDDDVVVRDDKRPKHGRRPKWQDDKVNTTLQED